MTFTANYPSASKWANKAINLFFPTVCALCGKLGPMICTDCLSQFARVSEPHCHRCGHTLIHAANACGNCLSPDFNLSQVRTTLVYREPVTNVIHALKYKGLFALSKPLAQLMVDSWPNWDESPELLIPIPLHPQRKKQRGFNQSELLADVVGQKENIPIARDALKRVKNTAPQIGLSPKERQENVRDAFAADPNVVKGKRILLMDDVFTTGSTMKAAAKELLASGTTSVSAYCLAGTV